MYEKMADNRDLVSRHCQVERCVFEMVFGLDRDSHLEKVLHVHSREPS